MAQAQTQRWRVASKMVETHGDLFIENFVDCLHKRFGDYKNQIAKLQARAEKAESMVERLIEARGNAYMFLQLMNEWDDYVAERKECEKNGN